MGLAWAFFFFPFFFLPSKHTRILALPQGHITPLQGTAQTRRHRTRSSEGQRGAPQRNVASPRARVLGPPRHSCNVANAHACRIKTDPEPPRLPEPLWQRPSVGQPRWGTRGRRASIPRGRSVRETAIESPCSQTGRAQPDPETHSSATAGPWAGGVTTSSPARAHGPFPKWGGEGSPHHPAYSASCPWALLPSGLRARPRRRSPGRAASAGLLRGTTPGISSEEGARPSRPRAAAPLPLPFHLCPSPLIISFLFLAGRLRPWRQAV